MNSSEMKYISVSSPLTGNISEIYSPPNITQGDFHAANWKRPSVNEGSFTSSLSDSQESDSESLVQETQYQLELQQWIDESEELVELCSDELENDSLEGDSLEEMILKEGLEDETDQCTIGKQKNNGDGRRQQAVDKYSSLRYNPSWRNTREVAELSEAEQACQVAGRSSMDFAQDAFYLHSNDFSEEKNQQEAKAQGSFSEFGTKSPSSPKTSAVGSNEPFRLCTKGKESAGGCHFKASPTAFALHTQEGRPQKAKKNFVEKNKQTLGFPSEKRNSYLQLHSKKQQVLLQEQDHRNKSSQRNKVKSNQSLRERAFPRNDSQQPPGRSEEAKSWYHQISEFQAAPMQAVEQDNSSTLQKWLGAGPSVGLDTHVAANSHSCLNNFPNFVNQDFTTSAYPFQSTPQKFNPAESVSSTYTSKETKKYLHDSPNGLLHDQQHSYNHGTVQPSARGDSTNGQAHPNQRNIPSTFNAHFPGLLMDQASLQDCKRHICVAKRYQNCARSGLGSPTAPCATSHFAQMWEQHHQAISRVAEAHLADRHMFNLLPPTVPLVESDSELDPENGEGNQVQTSRSNSEGSLVQREKQNQPKVSRKPHISKAYINLNVKLGGLGPDYEAIKEKKERLKQLKEYAKQIKEHNMRSIASVQRLPAKPQIVSSVSRQKALEYAKKIPRPKTFMARQSDEEVKEERVLFTSHEDSLPQIASLETLRTRHEKEKQIVAAFRTLHIL
ncbi:jhy protein homolog [Indicator indicator]|uniref:jhy protein homolog n=1 Tax=Indicator indicator TaxID=1002788 RepID=UPI0023DF5805|nr:jhy protein homolog [Indicator indicator]